MGGDGEEARSARLPASPAHQVSFTNTSVFGAVCRGFISGRRAAPVGGEFPTLKAGDVGIPPAGVVWAMRCSVLTPLPVQDGVLSVPDVEHLEKILRYLLSVGHS